MHEFGCVILAGGSGSRFGTKKQFQFLDHRRLWEVVKEKAAAVSKEVVVVGIDIPPGETRQGSVYNGLMHIKSPRVVVLEAARPLVEEKQILQIGTHKHASVSYAMPTVETVYDVHNQVYVDRTKSYGLQVPQAFDTELIREAHRLSTHTTATDDTMLMFQAHKISPFLVPGNSNLYKVTFPYDLEVLRVLRKYYYDE